MLYWWSVATPSKHASTAPPLWRTNLISISGMLHDLLAKILSNEKMVQDGRIWKEILSSTSARMRTELPVVNEGSQLASEAEAPAAKPPRPTTRRTILPSVSAPEGNFIDILEEYNASKEQNAGNSNLMQQ